MSRRLTASDYMEEVAARALGLPPSAGFPSPATAHLGLAMGHSQMGRAQAPSGRHRWLKRLVLRMAHIFAKEQIVYNQEIACCIDWLDREIVDLKRRVRILESAGEGDHLPPSHPR